MADVKISVIIPVYLAEDYIGKTLESLLFSTEKDIEVITVIDGSPDSSEDICKQYAENDARVKVIVKENGGVSSARNRGLDEARGAWIGFVDADDLVDADMYEYLYGLAINNNSLISQCAIKIKSKKTENIIYNRKTGIPVSENELYSSLSASVCNKLYSRKAINSVRFDERYPIGEDMDFNLKVLTQNTPIVFGEEAKYTYLQHKSSATGNKPDKAKLLSYSKMIRDNMTRTDISETKYCFLAKELVLSDLHIASILLRNSDLFTEELFCEIRNEIKGTYRSAKRALCFKTRIKAALLTYFPALYKLIIRAIHKRNR